MKYEELMDSDQNTDAILNELDPKYDKRPGTFQYAIASAVATKIAEFAQLLSVSEDERFPDTASYWTLGRHMSTRGLNLKEATHGEFKMYVTSNTINVDAGTRLVHENNTYTYKVVSKLADETIENVTYGVFKISCETDGSEPNNLVSGRLLFLDSTPDGLQTCTLGSCITLGEDREEELDAKNRYYASFEDKRYGCNLADYKSICENIAGVGGCRIYTPSQWNYEDTGYNIKIVVISSQNTALSESKVTEVQTTIDPTSNSGEGLGLASIGHYVKVENVEEIQIKIKATLEFLDGYSFTACQSAIETAITTYLQQLAAEWKEDDLVNSHPCLVVKIAKLIAAISSVEGVNDVSNIQINDETANTNFTLKSNQIPVFGSISEVVA